MDLAYELESIVHGQHMYENGHGIQAWTICAGIGMFQHGAAAFLTGSCSAGQMCWPA